MMKLFSLTSDLHGEFTMPASEEKFIQDIEAALGENFEFGKSDFSDYDGVEDIIYVRTGGTEGIFKNIFCQSGKPEIPGYVKLLTSGKSNSLAASMEILSYLVQHNIPAEIVHGDAQTIASALRSRKSSKPATQRTAMCPNKVLEGKRLGVVGHPSDWLISSDVDYSKAAEILGVTLVDIPMSELLEEYKTGKIEEAPALKPLNEPKFGKPISDKTLHDALLVYSALKRIKNKYSLDGLTIRCFDLLTEISNTGCMALAILNSEGISGTCEGDVPAMLTMAVGQALTGAPGFQVNLSQAWEDNLLFAHCTVPLNMVNDYVYDTHFESGIGVAVHGILPEGPATIFKIGSDLTHFIAKDVELVRNQYECNLCRTQVVIKSEDLKDYMLNEPLGNHHVILMGHHADELKRALFPYKRLLTIQDISCVGQCSLTVALPIISACGIETAILPSSILSNHTGGFTGWTFRDLTDEMPAILSQWKNQNIDFDAFYTGYVSKAQIPHILDIMSQLARPNAIRIVDPVMGDYGKLYAGFDEGFPAEMKKLIKGADVILPNMTEACLLLGKPYKASGYDMTYVEEILAELYALGAKNVVLTGISLEDGRYGVACYDGSRVEYYFTEHVDVAMHGTGDIFASAFTGSLLRGKSILEAASIAADFVLESIKLTVGDKSHWYGVKFEKALPSLIARF